MQGPNQAISADGLSPIARTVAASTPAARPRQPAWAAPITPALANANNTGRQSALRIAHTRPSACVNDASLLAAGASASATSLPCTWRNQQGSPGNFAAAARHLRFSATAAASSPTWLPRFSDSYLPALVPPVRKVDSARTPGGAGQSGVSQPMLTAIPGLPRYLRV